MTKMTERDQVSASSRSGMKHGCTAGCEASGTGTAVSSGASPPSPLDTMAAEMVGDGCLPNLFFVCDRQARTSAVFAEESCAVQYAERFGFHYVEDRLCGEIWASHERQLEGLREA